MRRVRDLPCGEMRIYLEVEIRCVDCKSCGKVKQEKLAWLADKLVGEIGADLPDRG